MRYDLAVLSDLVIDVLLPVEHLPIESGKHQWTPGPTDELGGGCNFLVAARRVNLNVVALGGVGHDAYGDSMIRLLDEEGVDTSQIRRFPTRITDYCYVISDDKGGHMYLLVERERPEWGIQPGWLETIRQARGALLDGYIFRGLIHPPEILAAMDMARENHIPIFFDPGPSALSIPVETLKEAIRRATVLLLTADEAAPLTTETGPAAIAVALQKLGPEAVVVKVGAQGCYLASAEGVAHHPGFAIEMIDTVGAGDSFASTFAAAYLRGGSWRDCATAANAMGAVVASVRGAGRQIPSADCLLALLGDDPATRLVLSD